VPPLLSPGKPLPPGVTIASGQITLSLVTGNGLRVAIRTDIFQGMASYSPEFDGGPLVVQVVPVRSDPMDIDALVQLDDYVRTVHGDATRLLVESFTQFEDVVQAYHRGAIVPPSSGWGIMPIQVIEADPFRGMRTAIALATSHYLNANVPQ